MGLGDIAPIIEAEWSLLAPTLGEAPPIAPKTIPPHFSLDKL